MGRSTFVPKTIFRRSIRLKQMDSTFWTIQTHSDELNWARRRTFHELNSLSLVRLLKSSKFGLGLTLHCIAWQFYIKLYLKESLTSFIIWKGKKSAVSLLHLYPPFCSFRSALLLERKLYICTTWMIRIIPSSLPSR